MRNATAWLHYYRSNNLHLLDVPWDDTQALSLAERRAIAKSIAEFQRGESSEGRQLYKRAAAYAQAHADQDFLAATALFIKEEQRHARDLGRFMEMAGMARLRSAWPDRVFRGLRHFGGIDVSTTVLVTAEIIARAYYPALQRATTHPVLKAICDQIIADEQAHVQFQCERIAAFRQQRHYLSKLLAEQIHAVLFLGTVLVVWRQHGRVFRAAGMSFGAYWNEVWRYFEEAMQVVRTHTALSRFEPRWAQRQLQ